MKSPEIEYNDGVRKLFLYTGGSKGGTKALQDLLAYIQNTTEENAVDEDLKKLHVNVQRLKSNNQIGVKYMHMQEVIKYAVKAEVEEIVKQKMDEMVKQKTEEIIKQTEEIIKQKTEEVEQVMNAASQNVDAAKQEADVAKQEADAAKQEMEVYKKIMHRLLEEKRFDDLRRITTDEAFFEQMLKEFDNK